MNLTALPDLLALATLVGGFISLLRKHAGNHLGLWLAGWIFILIHFTAELFDSGNGIWHLSMLTVSMWMLEMCGMAFVWAAVHREVSGHSRWTAVAIAFTPLAYTAALIWGVQSPAAYIALIAPMLLGSSSSLAASLRRKPRGIGPIPQGLIAFVLSIILLTSINSQGDIGLTAILAGVYYCAALHYWQRFRRPTTGVLTAVGGLIAWGSVFPLGLIAEKFYPSVPIEAEVWNIPKYIVAVGIVLTLLEEQIELTEHLALHDELTGLPNRRLLEDRLSKALDTAKRNGTYVGVLVVDLDGFKQVNDTFGHRSGDQLLRLIVARLSTRIRQSDTFARTGGDEFTIVATGLGNREAADRLASDLRSALHQPIHFDGQEVHAGASIGVAVYPEDAIDGETLRLISDKAMYEVKRQIRSGYA